MKRIGNIWEDVICLDNALEAIIEGTLYKRSQREVQKLLYDAEDVNRDPSLWHRIDRKRASHCDSVTFIENDINPYVNIKQTRRIIGYVDKKRKQQTG